MCIEREIQTMFHFPARPLHKIKNGKVLDNSAQLLAILSCHIKIVPLTNSLSQN